MIIAAVALIVFCSIVIVFAAYMKHKESTVNIKRRIGCLRIDYYYKTNDGDTADPDSWEYPITYVHVEGWTFSFVKQGAQTHKDIENLARLNSNADYDATASVQTVMKPVKLLHGSMSYEPFKIAASATAKEASIKTKLIAAVQYLSEQGCETIVADCGFCAYFQKSVVDIVNTSCTKPMGVILSSLMLAPLIKTITPPQNTTLVFTADDTSLTQENLTQILVDLNGIDFYSADQSELQSFVVIGFQDVPNFGPQVKNGEPVIKEESEQAFLDLARAKIITNNAHTIILECTEMGMFSNAIRNLKVDGRRLVVYDSITAGVIAHIGRARDHFG